MNDIEPSRPSAIPITTGKSCRYCGAQLVQGIYFCLACATPHSPVESYLPASLPPYLSDGILVTRKAPQVAPLFWTYFGAVLGTGILGFFIFGPGRPDLAMLLSSIVLVIITCFFSVRHWPALAVQLRRFGFFDPSAWLAIFALAPLLGINYLYHEVLLRYCGLPREALDLNRMGISSQGMIVLFCVLPAITEEIAFRGLVQHWLQIALRPWRAMILASALFTILHFSVLSAPYLFAVGMLLGWAKWKTQSLYPSMLIHFMHNFAVLAFF